MINFGAINLKKVFRSSLDTAKENLAGQILSQPKVVETVRKEGLKTADSFVNAKKYQIAGIGVFLFLIIGYLFFGKK